MLEKMSDFFENRLDGYDKHMLNDIESADKFYPFTAKQLRLWIFSARSANDCTIAFCVSVAGTFTTW